MIRKLIQISPSTKVVSLPTKWLKHNGLLKGDELVLQESENKLIISTNAQKTTSEVTISFDGLSERLCWTYLDAAYSAGYDLITVLLTSSQHSKVIVSATSEVPGMLLIVHTNSKAVFKDITGGNPEDLDILVLRIFNMLISLSEEIEGFLETKDWVNLQKIKSRDYAINAYTSYAQRQINKFGYRTFSKNGVMTTLLKLLEIVADEMCEESLRLVESRKRSDFADLTKTLVSLRKAHEKYSVANIKSCQSSSKLISQDVIRGLFHDIIETEVQLHL
jgi:phosphate uptake regulator